MFHPAASRWSVRVVFAFALALACGGGEGPSDPTGGAGGKPAGSGGAKGSGGAPAQTGGGPAVEPGNGGAGGSGSGSGGSGTPDAGQAPDGGQMPPNPNQPLPGCVRTVNVSSSEMLAAAIGAVVPGDCIVLADGTYTFPMITARATIEAPIVIKAANTLKAVVETGSVLMVDAANVTVEGLHFRSNGYIGMNNCERCRVSRFRIERQESGAGEQDWVVVGGTSKHCRIDHNDFGPQNATANMIMLSGVSDQVVQYTLIDHNHFHDINYGSGNGWEIIRAGLSQWSFKDAFTIIERNLFVKADSDPETVSLKSSRNIIRYNTMRATRGQFTLRHGNYNEVYGNYIIADGRTTQAMRVYGGNHKIYNNYVEGAATGIAIDSGSNTDDNGNLTDHKVTYDLVLAFNTVLGGAIRIGGTKPLAPRNITAANNVGNISIVGGAQVRQMGNLADARLTKMGEVFRLAAGSPAVDAAAGAEMFPFITEDIDGRPRAKADVGAQELSDAPPKYGLLTAKDVGPLAP